MWKTIVHGQIKQLFYPIYRDRHNKRYIFVTPVKTTMEEEFTYAIRPVSSTNVLS